MPDEYWSKVGAVPKPKKVGPRFIPVPAIKPAASAGKESDGSELFWCGVCKENQVEKKRWARDKDAHVRCRGCGRIIYPKHEKVARVCVVKLCKHCQAPLRKGNGSGACALCSRT